MKFPSAADDQEVTTTGQPEVAYVTIPTTGGPVVVPLSEEAREVSVTEIQVTVDTTTISSTTETSTLVTSTSGNVTVTRLNVTTTFPPGLPSGQVPPSPAPKSSDLDDSLESGDRRAWFEALPPHWQVVVVVGSIWGIVFILLISIKLGGWTTVVHMVSLTRDYVAGSLNANSVAQFLQSLADRIRSSAEVVEPPAPPPNTPEPDHHQQDIYWVNIF